MGEKRVLLSFSEDSYDELDKLKNELQASNVADVIKDALTVFRWAVGEWKTGSEILSHNPDGGYTKPVFTFTHEG